MFNEKELSFQCPYCFETITFLCEELFGNQTYIEDCEVCCAPIEISYRTRDGEIESFEVRKAN